MANNPIIEPEGGGVFLPISPDLEEAGLSPEQAVVDISSQIQSIQRKINGGLGFGTDENSSRVGNHDAQSLTVIFPGSADVERVIPHGLNRVPVGYIPVRKDRACDIYDSTETAWGESSLSLKCSVADAQVSLWVW